MNAASINTQLELDIKIDFERAMPGASMSDECLQELADRFRISATVPDILQEEPCVSDDADNILTQDAAGCLRVPRDLYHKQCQTIPKPAVVQGNDGRFLLDVEHRCISKVILADGCVIDIPNSGKTEDCSDTDPSAGWDITLTGAPYVLGDIGMTDGTVYTFPDLSELTIAALVTTANSHASTNGYPLTFSQSGSYLHVTESSGKYLDYVNDAGADPQKRAVIRGPQEDCKFVEAADWQTFVDNLNSEQSEVVFEWDDKNNLVATTTTGEDIAQVIVCDPDGIVKSKLVEAVPLQGEVPGDGFATFSEGADIKGIDYTAAGMLWTDFQPSTGYSRIDIEQLKSGEVRYKIVEQTTDVEACLVAFTPAAPEDETEF